MASISALSTSLAWSPASFFAFWMFSNARGASSRPIGPFRYGPQAHASAQKHIAQFGSSRWACRKERAARSGVKAYIIWMPWLKNFCASGEAVVIARVRGPSASG